MSKALTVASPLLTSIASIKLTPAQRSAVWEIAAVLDERHIATKHDDAIWLEVDTARLRGTDGRNDNIWLRELLDRLTGVKLGGTYRGDRWGGVLLAEWRLERGGTMVRLLLPPSGVQAMRAPETFAKIDKEAAHRLPPHARTLYGLLADRQRQNVKRWEPELDELKALLGIADKYQGRFNHLKARVLDPAVQAIRDFGVIDLHYEPVRLGRGVRWVRFTWNLKNPRTATETVIENGRHSDARGKDQQAADAPPLVVTDAALHWLDQQSSAEKVRWAKRARELGANAPSTRNPNTWIGWVATEIRDHARLNV